MRPIGIVGNLSRDRIDGGPPCTGGGAFHCARGLRAFGRLGVIVTRSSVDDRRELLPPLVRLGLPVRWRPGEPTTAFALDYDGEERRLAVEAISEPWAAEDALGWVRNSLRGVEWVHVAPLLRSDFPPETIAALARGRRLSLDGQGLARVSAVGPLQLDPHYDPEVLRHVSILKLAEDEAQLLVGGFDERTLSHLGVPEIVVTLGSRGSIVYADGLVEHVPARPRAADPTGAGDAFAAVYLACRATRFSPVAAAQRATALVGDLLVGRAA